MALQILVLSEQVDNYDVADISAKNMHWTLKSQRALKRGLYAWQAFHISYPKCALPYKVETQHQSKNDRFTFAQISLDQLTDHGIQ